MGEVKLVKHLSEPWFTLVAGGQKTSEGRLNTVQYASLQAGDLIKFYNVDSDVYREFFAEVSSVQHYNSFTELIEGEGLPTVLPSPGVTNTGEGVAVYRQFYSEEAELENGVVAVRVRVADTYTSSHRS